MFYFHIDSDLCHTRKQTGLSIINDEAVCQKNKSCNQKQPAGKKEVVQNVDPHVAAPVRENTRMRECATKHYIACAADLLQPWPKFSSLSAQQRLGKLCWAMFSFTAMWRVGDTSIGVRSFTSSRPAKQPMQWGLRVFLPYSRRALPSAPMMLGEKNTSRIQSLRHKKEGKR